MLIPHPTAIRDTRVEETTIIIATSIFCDYFQVFAVYRIGIARFFAEWVPYFLGGGAMVIWDFFSNKKLLMFAFFTQDYPFDI